MNSESIYRQQSDSPWTSVPKRFFGATVAAVLVVWWGIHFNSLIQAVVAACETQLTNPAGSHVLHDMELGANVAMLFVYGIGVTIALSTAFAVWPTFLIWPPFPIIPGRSRSWRLPIFVALSCILPVCVIAVEAFSGANRASDRWSGAGFNHLTIDAAGYLLLGVSYGVVAWMTYEIYMARRWGFFAWTGFGFAAIAVPCSLVALFYRSSSTDLECLIRLSNSIIVPWPIIDTLLCLTGAILGGVGWVVLRRGNIASPRKA